MQPDSLRRLPIRKLASQLRAGELSCLELTGRCLARIDEYDSKINAWVIVDRESALTQAKLRDDQLSGGHDLGLLHGIPVGIKDIIDVAGWPTAAGFKPWADRIVDRDAPLVSLLRAAGAVIPGKTVTTQFACFNPPITFNPYDRKRTPGGSSSGSAAAVSMGMCVASIGTQTGGSIIRPASYCGVYGFKPGFDRVPTEGVIPVSPTLDHCGPIATGVDDLSIMYEALGGGASPGQRAEPPRMGRVRGCFANDASSDMLKALDDAIERIASTNAPIIEVALPDSFDQVLHHHRVIMTYEMALVHQQWLAEGADFYYDEVKDLLAEGSDHSPRDYDQALRYRLDLCEQMQLCFEGVDALIMPATPAAPPATSTTGSPSFNAPWSLLGLPELSMPMPESMPPPLGGKSGPLPLALQLVGAQGMDADLLSTSLWVENALKQRA